MIKRIDIKKFGLFKDYSWEAVIGKNNTFRRVNIIYGRNYSGKTTLSRIFKCVEDGFLHDNYLDCDFALTRSDDTRITHIQLNGQENDYRFRVYNKDFVQDNLSWLYNDDGTIKPFTVLGAKNVELDKQIKEIDEKLGSIEGETGLLYEHQKKQAALEAKRQEYQTKSTDLDNKLRDKARKIKNNAATFNLPTYQINSIKTDILNVEESSILSEDLVHEKKKLLKEESKGDISKLLESKPQFDSIKTGTIELLERKIKPSKPLAYLVNDSLLQEWVRQGIERHKTEKKICGFCQNPIDPELWKKLDAHFNKESEDLRKELKAKIDSLEQEKLNLDDFLDLTKEMFYAGLIVKYDELTKQWKSTTKTYKNSLDELIKALKGREKDIFKEQQLAELADVSGNILEIIKRFNLLIDEHNTKTSTLSSDQQQARTDLRLSEVAQYIIDIDYKAKQVEINNLNDKVKQHQAEVLASREEIEKLSEKKRTLEAQGKDESKGAELVNYHLTHFFGHDELKLVTEGETPNMKFNIVREGEPAKNLSEGESSLISFCYFIARMGDELKDEVNSGKLIIYIDDPISSLDSNHIFFMFSLIESIIAKPKKYGQLFLSTHNLDFLKYLRKLSTPRYKPFPESKSKPDINHFLIERKSRGNIGLRLAPDYLKMYITEFNYLFHHIYHCSLADITTIEHHYQYNFGNNMRKFLEAFLFYKYPNHKLSFEERIEKFFDDDNVSFNLVKRVVHEYSHLGEQFDRGMEPIDVAEIQKIAQAVINRIKICDEPQYDSLVESIQA